ncbi:hypothetical protein LINPERPRIM_LOCUS12194 [Linum perenne]
MSLTYRPLQTRGSALETDRHNLLADLDRVKTLPSLEDYHHGVLIVLCVLCNHSLSVNQAFIESNPTVKKIHNNKVIPSFHRFDLKIYRVSGRKYCWITIEIFSKSEILTEYPSISTHTK